MRRWILIGGVVCGMMGCASSRSVMGNLPSAEGASQNAVKVSARPVAKGPEDTTSPIAPIRPPSAVPNESTNYRSLATAEPGTVR